MLFSYFLAALLAAVAAATSLTTKLPAGDRSCFFAWGDKAGTKIAFYFAVQSGGNFDIDYAVTGPNERIVLDGERERQGDFVFTVNEVGEYRFCFNNAFSSTADKTVDFEITVENESRAQLPSKQGAPAEQTSLLSESIYKLSGQISTITRQQKYFRTRENRNFSTVRSTETRIFRFSLIESATIVGMAALQVFVVRFFFQGARKGFV